MSINRFHKAEIKDVEIIDVCQTEYDLLMHLVKYYNEQIADLFYNYVEWMYWKHTDRDPFEKISVDGYFRSPRGEQYAFTFVSNPNCA